MHTHSRKIAIRRVEPGREPYSSERVVRILGVELCKKYFNIFALQVEIFCHLGFDGRFFVQLETVSCVSHSKREKIIILIKYFRISLFYSERVFGEIHHGSYSNLTKVEIGFFKVY